MEAPFRDRKSRGKAAGYLACAAPLCAVGFWLAFSFDNNVAIGTGGAMALFFGYHAVYFILVLFRPSEMIISEQGVRIEHGRGGPAWPWRSASTRRSPTPWSSRPPCGRPRSAAAGN